MAKTRKGAKKSSAKKATKKASKKPTGGAKKASGPKAYAPRIVRRGGKKEVDFKPLKDHVKAHIDVLSRANQDDERVKTALDSLRRMQSALSDACIPTMTAPAN